MTPTSLVRLFLDAVRVDAISLKERPMAEFIRAALRGVPVSVHEDGSARHFNGDCGNLVCVPDGFDAGRPAIALIAHMDTPRSTASVRPVLSDTAISSDGTTALGVDNRAGSSVLLHVLREHFSGGAGGNFIVVFTAGEELGLYGSKYVDLNPYNVKMCFVFDCSKRPGMFIQAAVGCSLYTVTFTGKAAHAAVAPEAGVNAIHVAAKALSRIPVGRLGPAMTSNVGMIAGGSATNIVPDRCTVHGEVREFDPRIISDHLASLHDTFQAVAAECGGGIEFMTAEDFAPFRLQPEDMIVRWTIKALREVGLTPHGIDYTGGSDANMLNARGMPAVNLGIGAQNPHGNDEFILIEDLQKSADIAHTLISWSSKIE